MFWKSKEDKELDKRVSELISSSIGTLSKNKDKLKVSKFKDSQPSIEDLIKYYQSTGLVGEENLCVLQTFCAIGRHSFGVEGTSGSGKTFIVDKLIDLLPKVYSLGLVSDKAIFNDLEAVNSSKFLYLPELQKALTNNGSTLEVIKNLTEGKDVTRKVSSSPNKIREYTIEKGKTLIYTLAKENNYKKDTELGRRFIVFETDNTQEHLEDVISQKAIARSTKPSKRKLSSKKTLELKNHIDYLVNADFEFFDPFGYWSQQLLPITPKTISYADKYFNLVNACAKYHIKRRVVIDNTVLVSLQDHKIIHALYHETFLNTLQELEKQDYEEQINKTRIDIDWDEVLPKGIETLSQNYPNITFEWLRKELQEEGQNVTI